MEGLNYHHLLYFYTVARAGTIARASEQLHLTQPTISEQVRLLEKSLGNKLFQKSGRNLALTETGHMVFAYAEKIFALGRELTDSVNGRDVPERQARCEIGIACGVSEVLTHRLLEPVMALRKMVLSCHRDRLDALVTRLAAHELDVVLAAAPAPRSAKAFSNKLGECAISFFAAESLSAKYKAKFPRSLDRAPMLLPAAGSSGRILIEQWFKANAIRPAIVGEFEDAGLMTRFGKAGAGVFAAPKATEKELLRSSGVKVVGRTNSAIERYYLISRERKLSNAAAVAISKSAQKVFA